MKCSQVQKHIPLLVGGDLARDIERDLTEHMNTCLGCSREYQEYLAAMSSLQMLREKPDVSGILDGLSGEVMERIREAPIGPAAEIPRRMVAGPFAIVMRMAAAAAIVVMLVAGGFLIGQSTGTAIGPGADGAGGPRIVGDTNSVVPGHGIRDENFAGDPGSEENDPNRALLRPQQLPRVQPVSNRQGF